MFLVESTIECNSLEFDSIYIQKNAIRPQKKGENSHLSNLSYFEKQDVVVLHLSPVVLQSVDGGVERVLFPVGLFFLYFTVVKNEKVFLSDPDGLGRTTRFGSGHLS